MGTVYPNIIKAVPDRLHLYFVFWTALSRCIPKFEFLQVKRLGCPVLKCVCVYALG